MSYLGIDIILSHKDRTGNKKDEDDEICRALNHILMGTKPRRIGPEIAEHPIRTQQPHCSQHAKECEIVDECRKQQTHNDHKIAKRRKVKELTARITISIEPRCEFRGQREGE